MKIVATYSIKGGVGKTAAAVNLAYAAAKEGKETLLVDLDPQGASSFYYRVGASKRLKGKLFFTKRKRVLANIKESDFPHLDILPANLSFRNFDIMLAAMQKSKNRLSDILRSLEDEFDMVVLDCPPNITLLAENIFNAADIIAVPVIPTPLSERTYEQLLEFFDEKGYSKKKVCPFFSMVQKVNKIHKSTIKKMRNRHKRILDASIPLCVDIERMGVKREPVLHYAPKSVGAQSYTSLCKELLRQVK